MSVFVREVEFIEEELDRAKTNHILLEGYICKKPIYRKTPLGRRLRSFVGSEPSVRNPIISPASVGEEMPDLRPGLRWESMCRSLQDSKQRLCEEAVGGGNGNENGI